MIGGHLLVLAEKYVVLTGEIQEVRRGDAGLSGQWRGAEGNLIGLGQGEETAQ